MRLQKALMRLEESLGKLLLILLIRYQFLMLLLISDVAMADISFYVLINVVVFVHGNLVNIPIRGNSLDSVLYIAALHNIKGRTNRIQSLNEVKRILKNDGRALISVWSREQERFRDCFNDISGNDCELGDIVIYWRQNKLNAPRFYHLYTKEEFIEDIKQSGLEIEQFSEAKIQSKKYTDNYFAVVRKG
jgi:tRNA (uracil-5-)-methyltransferase TRM9